MNLVKYFFQLAVVMIVIPSNFILGLSEEKKIKESYFEIGIGYPVLMIHGSKMQDNLDKNDWQENLFKLDFITGYYSSLGEKKWLFGPELAIFYHPYTQKYNTDSSLTYFHYLGFASSRYYLLGEIGNGLFLSDKLGFSLVDVKRKGDGKSDSLGLTAGIAFGAGVGYSYKLNLETSLSFQLCFVWDAIGATTGDGYSLDTKSVHLWVGVLF